MDLYFAFRANKIPRGPPVIVINSAFLDKKIRKLFIEKLQEVQWASCLD